LVINIVSKKHKTGRKYTGFVMELKLGAINTDYVEEIL